MPAVGGLQVEDEGLCGKARSLDKLRATLIPDTHDLEYRYGYERMEFIELSDDVF